MTVGPQLTRDEGDLGVAKLSLHINSLSLCFSSHSQSIPLSI